MREEGLTQGLIRSPPPPLVTPVTPCKEVAGVFLLLLLLLLSCAGGADGERDEWGEECRRQTSALGRRVGMLGALFPPPRDSARGGGGVAINSEGRGGRTACEKSHLTDGRTVGPATSKSRLLVLGSAGTAAGRQLVPPPPSNPSRRTYGGQRVRNGNHKRQFASLFSPFPAAPLLFSLPPLHSPLNFPSPSFPPLPLPLVPSRVYRGGAQPSFLV